MTVWMLVDLKDKELPIIVANNISELAAKAGVKVETIRTSICNAKSRGHRCRYVKVEAEDGEL